MPRGANVFLASLSLKTLTLPRLFSFPFVLAPTLTALWNTPKAAVSTGSLHYRQSNSDRRRMIHGSGDLQVLQWEGVQGRRGLQAACTGQQDPPLEGEAGA